jgi:GT2 family glycosyltransferase
MVEARFGYAKLIRSATNLGFAKANNLGIKASTGRYVALLNSDIRVLSGCMDAMVACLDEHPRVGLGGPRVLNSDLSTQPTCRHFPSIRRSFCLAAGLSRLFPRSPLFSSEEMRFWSHETERTVDALKGCFLVARRKALKEFGLLDESFFIYSEDVDWCRRCWNAGWQVSFFPQARAVHHSAASSRHDPARFMVELERSNLRYWSKHHSVAGRAANWFLLLLEHSARCARAGIVFACRPDKRELASQELKSRGACVSMLLRG